MPQKLYSPSFHKKGFTLTELAIVMGVTGFVMGAVWLAYSQVTSSNKVNRAVTEVAAIVQGVRDLHPNGLSTGGQSLGGMLINANALPPDILGPCLGTRWTPAQGNGTICILSPWGGQVIVGTQAGWGGLTASTQRFEILFEADPAYPLPCSPFLNAVINPAITAGLVAINIVVGPQTITGLMSPAAIAAQCINNGGEIDLQFKL